MKIQAYRISDAVLKANRMPNVNELNDGSAKITPVKIRNVSSFGYHVAEDVKGNIYLINDDEVMLKKLNSRNLGVTETKYLLDGLGKQQIAASKQATQSAESVVEEVVEEPEVITKESEVSETISEETEGVSNE